MFELIEDAELLPAFLLTIQLALWSALFALVLGTIVAILRLAPVAVLNALGASYVTLVRNTPLTLIVVACSLVLWGQLGIEPANRRLPDGSGNPDFISSLNFRLGVIGLSIYHAAFVCEAIRSGVNTIPLGQAEAARSIGLTFPQSLREVILPQAFRGAITPLGNVLIALVKNTTVVAAIGVFETAYRMRWIAEFRPADLMPGFALVALGFVILTLPLGLLVSHLSQRLAVRR
jgi:glutamate transport system permease protein